MILKVFALFINQDSESDDNSIYLILTSSSYNVDIYYNCYKEDISYSECLEFTEK